MLKIHSLEYNSNPIFTFSIKVITIVYNYEEISREVGVLVNRYSRLVF